MDEFCSVCDTEMYQTSKKFTPYQDNNDYILFKCNNCFQMKLKQKSVTYVDFYKDDLHNYYFNSLHSISDVAPINIGELKILVISKKKISNIIHQEFIKETVNSFNTNVRLIFNSYCYGSDESDFILNENFDIVYIHDFEHCIYPKNIMKFLQTNVNCIFVKTLKNIVKQNDDNLNINLYNCNSMKILCNLFGLYINKVTEYKDTYLFEISREQKNDDNISSFIYNEMINDYYLTNIL